MDPKKKCSLVEYLLRQNRPVTAKELASFLNFSVRSVKAYIASINRETEESVIQSGHCGYEIISTNGEAYLKRNRPLPEDIPQNYEERANYINRKFLSYHTRQLNLFDLADELCYSVETVRSDIQKMNRTFASFGVSYKLHSEQILLKADERSLRRLARFTLFGNGDKVIDYAAVRAAFDDIDIDQFKVILEETLLEYDFYINDFGMMNMVLHIAIILRRMAGENTLPFNREISADTSSMEYHAAQQFCRQMSKSFHIDFSGEEIQNIYMLLKSNINLPMTDSRKDFIQFVGSESMELAEEIVRRIDAKYYINLNSEPFLFPFSMHLKNMLFRARHHQSNINPMCGVIRYSHPIIFDMAVFTAALIQEKCRVRIDENEISYLALHIGGEMERQNENREKIRAVLLCPNYLEFAGKMYNQLLINFGGEIELVACISQPEEARRYRFDLLITTIETPLGSWEKTTVYVPFLGISRRRSEIENAIESVRESRRMKVLRTNFENYFSPQLFFVNRDESLSPFEILKMMAERMEEAGVVQSDFYDRLVEREIAASTAFSNIAVPHSMRLDAIKTSICVMLCPKGIPWGGQRVRIVLTVAINRADAPLFGNLYQALIGLFDNEKNLRMIVDKNTFEEFSNQLRQLM